MNQTTADDVIELFPPVRDNLKPVGFDAFLTAFGIVDHARCDSIHSDHRDERNSSLLLPHIS